jgi:hypothetical protein
MNNKRILLSLLVLGLLLVLAGGLALAQGPEQPDGEVSTEGEANLSVITLSYVPIQGRLTDAAGNALNGDYGIVATIYDASSGGTAVCSGSETTSVTNGLFMLNMLCWNQAITGQQLYLGIKVGDDPEMTPRQEILPVPYAITVYPGAIIKGDTSYLFVPGSEFIKRNSADLTTWYVDEGGSANIYAGSPGGGTRYVYIPITVPAVLYGQPVKVTHARVYYKCKNGDNGYIVNTRLYKQTDADSYVMLVNNITPQKSETATFYTLPLDPDNNTLSANEGILTLRLMLSFSNDSDFIQIGGVRLTLETSY